MAKKIRVYECLKLFKINLLHYEKIKIPKTKKINHITSINLV